MLANSQSGRTRRRVGKLGRSASVVMLALGVIVLSAASASAQFPIPTTIQLPTFQEFSVSTTVSVPDRGGIELGSVDRSWQSNISRGVPGGSRIPGLNRLTTNRGIGSEVAGSSVTAHVWIHDMDELDAVTRAAARPTGADAAIERKAAFIAKNLTRRPSTPTERETSVARKFDNKRR